MRALWPLLGLLPALAAQQRAEDGVRSPAGLVALRQAVRDAGVDALVLLVASHPDDRYILPGVWLRHDYGMRVAVLLASRGGGAQNSIGSETGDALERIRTLETEQGCEQFDAAVYHLGRPDGGFRRTAAETFAEWGRESTLRDMVRLLRSIRPDAVVSTHHRDEQHGHDLALVELLPEAVRLAADPACDVPGAPHRVHALLLGASTATTNLVRVDVERLDLDRGVTLRRRAYEILRAAHLSPGPPAPIDGVFDAELRMDLQFPPTLPLDGPRPLGLPSVLDADLWPGEPARAVAIDAFLRQQLPALVARGQDPWSQVAALVGELRALRAQARADVAVRLDRRIDALERLLLLGAGVQLEVDVPPGTIAVAGEQFIARVHLRAGSPLMGRMRLDGLDDVAVELSAFGEGEIAAGTVSADAVIGIPLATGVDGDPMASRFRAERFVPPVRLRARVPVAGIEVPIELALPVELRAPVELQVVPRMLLLPSARSTAQFSVGVVRNTQFPVEGELEVRAPAGYAARQEHTRVTLHDQRSDLFGFTVTAPADRKPGVDVLRIRLGANRIALPVHKVDVDVAPGLRLGLLRSRDDTLPSVLGSGGLGVAWSELSDADIAVADLRQFDTVVVDIRALRERPAARRAFRRLLEFATGRGRRLVVFYQKDVEFHPTGEGFLGAPYLPFQIGRNRVTRPDAPVRVLRPGHVLLRHPNAIRSSDWDGWEQERGLYLPGTYAGDYEEVLEIQDPGQPPQRGALLYARAGDGEFVYCALSLWRQLKKLHPGAVRLLANLITPVPPA